LRKQRLINQPTAVSSSELTLLPTAVTSANISTNFHDNFLKNVKLKNEPKQERLINALANRRNQRDH
jgi:hypothetical protein